MCVYWSELCSWCVFSKGHGTLGTSGVNTPFLTESGSTPSSTTVVSTSHEVTEQDLEVLSEKLQQRRKSFSKAVLQPTPTSRTPTLATTTTISPSSPPTANVNTKEHIEQGRVKTEVYLSYLAAASRVGFLFFVLCTVLAQIVNVAANNTLRAWGEHNREAGSNKGVGKYLVGYGVFSLASTLFGAAAAILIWVYCSLRSARRLHDSVSPG